VTGPRSLCACSRALHVCGRPGQVTELNLTNGLPELVKKSHDFSFLAAVMAAFVGNVAAMSVFPTRGHARKPSAPGLLAILLGDRLRASGLTCVRCLITTTPTGGSSEGKGIDSAISTNVKANPGGELERRWNEALLIEHRIEGESV
jgi:hypothetical protein